VEQHTKSCAVGALAGGACRQRMNDLSAEWVDVIRSRNYSQAHFDELNRRRFIISGHCRRLIGFMLEATVALPS
jgi:hypothetical protein